MLSDAEKFSEDCRSHLSHRFVNESAVKINGRSYEIGPEISCFTQSFDLCGGVWPS